MWMKSDVSILEAVCNTYWPVLTDLELDALIRVLGKVSEYRDFDTIKDKDRHATAEALRLALDGNIFSNKEFGRVTRLVRLFDPIFDKKPHSPIQTPDVPLVWDEESHAPVNANEQMRDFILRHPEITGCERIVLVSGKSPSPDVHSLALRAQRVLQTDSLVYFILKENNFLTNEQREQIRGKSVLLIVDFLEKDDGILKAKQALEGFQASVVRVLLAHKYDRREEVLPPQIEQIEEGNVTIDLGAFLQESEDFQSHPTLWCALRFLDSRLEIASQICNLDVLNFYLKRSPKQQPTPFMLEDSQDLFLLPKGRGNAELSEIAVEVMARTLHAQGIPPNVIPDAEEYLNYLIQHLDQFPLNRLRARNIPVIGEALQRRASHLLRSSGHTTVNHHGWAKKLADRAHAAASREALKERTSPLGSSGGALRLLRGPRNR